jgi:hypothetical protein
MTTQTEIDAKNEAITADEAQDAKSEVVVMKEAPDARSEVSELDEESDAQSELTVAQMEGQLKAWSDQLDHLVAGYLRAGAQAHDPYRLRIDALRALHGSAQTKLQAYTSVADPTGMWGAFWDGIKDDLKALEDGFEDLTPTFH